MNWWTLYRRLMWSLIIVEREKEIGREREREREREKIERAPKL